MAQRMGVPFFCSYCGQPLEPWQDWGGEALWNCKTIGCANNLNNEFKFDIESLDTYIPHNTTRLWNEWMPKRLI